MPFSEIDVIDQIARHERGIAGISYSYLGAQNPDGKPNVPGVLHLSPRFLCRPIAFNNEWKKFAEITSYLLVCPRESYGGKLSKIEASAIPFGERWRNKFQDRNTISEISRDLPRVLLLELSSAKYRTDIEHDGITWVGWEFTFNVEYQEIGNMTISPYYNVTDYGAIGDSAADDTTAINNAIAAVPTNGGTVVFPPGTYRITSPITLKARTILRGSGQQASVILCDGCDGLTFSGPVSLNENCMLVQAEDLTVRGDYTSSKIGINLDHVIHLFLNRVCVEKFSSHGIQLDTIITGTISDCLIQKNDGDGLKYLGTVNNVTCIGGSLLYNNGAGATLTGADLNDTNRSVKFIGVTIEENRAAGLTIDFSHNIAIIDSYFENNKSVNTGTGRGTFSAPAVGYNIQLGPNMASGGINGTAIYANHFSDIESNGEGYHIRLYRVNGCTIDGNGFIDSGSGYTRAIYNDATTNLNVNVGTGNYYEGETRETSGSSTFNGTTGQQISFQLIMGGIGTYIISITPTASMVGQWYVTKGSSSFTVYSTSSSDSGTFDWFVLRES